MAQSMPGQSHTLGGCCAVGVCAWDNGHTGGPLLLEGGRGKGEAVQVQPSSNQAQGRSKGLLLKNQPTTIG